ncbi:Rgg/GadR/MutR family transcriptional regulator [Streptococcus ovuberis]|uniref:Rgg/GadR/MutR family transcriptional regulator n=1 Tax=Streptococcus ovuberis TaxID=1936207 RepID=A0A7X6N091_9STRE|nr:Rgg/GadR/MutR family transcriptional regulator [Streptococcus ovuberis]NKZ19822.1 Rgg/GadR/MutR family transcriptional regulator [Streptococcus ovuberis]
MQNLGLIFKRVRESRGISLADATGGEFSISMLSRFENGKSEMSAEKLRTCLGNIYLGMADFDFLVSEFQPTEFAVLQDKIREYSHPFQKQAFLKLLAEQEALYQEGKKQQFYRLNSIWIKSTISFFDEAYVIPKADVTFLVDYLFSTDFWARYELVIFADTCHFFSSRVYLGYCREMLTRSVFFAQDFINQNLIHTILVNGLFHAVSAHDFFEATQFEFLLTTYFSETRDAYMRIVEKIARGYHQMEAGQEEGKMAIEQGIALFQQLGYAREADYFRKQLTL